LQAYDDRSARAWAGQFRIHSRALKLPPTGWNPCRNLAAISERICCPKSVSRGWLHRNYCGRLATRSIRSTACGYRERWGADYPDRGWNVARTHCGPRLSLPAGHWFLACLGASACLSRRLAVAVLDVVGTASTTPPRV
jgi:hypothetical protein